MHSESFVTAPCPYCNAQLQLRIDCYDLDQEYIEDCQRCCRPITVTAHTTSQGEIDVVLRTEDD